MSKFSDISQKAIIGKNVSIGNFCTIHDNVEIYDNVIIEDNCVIGNPTSLANGKPLVIGANSVIRSHSTLYEGTNLGECFQGGHHLLIRENAIIGKHTSVGSFSDIEGDCLIGDYGRFHSYVHIGKGSEIGNLVKIYSLVTLTNDPLPPSGIVSPVKIEDGVVVCVNCTLLPGTVMKEGSYAASGTIITGEINPGAVVTGPDCERRGHVSMLMNLEHGIRHPWTNHFASHYPEEAQSEIQELGKRIKESKKVLV
jgi:acetyltransferase-like isoleucine patch superfamily enzyme